MELCNRHVVAYYGKQMREARDALAKFPRPDGNIARPWRVQLRYASDMVTREIVRLHSPEVLVNLPAPVQPF